MRGDLFVLVSDQDMLQAVEGLLSRPKSLNMAPVSFEVRRHPGRDSGCRISAADYLRAFVESYRYAIVMFDLDGSGSHRSRIETQQEVDRGLNLRGWEQRSKCIVIEPELEAWVWSRSERVPEVLGWLGRYTELQAWLHEQGLWPEHSHKPPNPKEAMRRTMQRTRSRRSPRKFFELASRASVRGCEDPSFGEFKRTLRTWFPQHAGQSVRADRLR